METAWDNLWFYVKGTLELAAKGFADKLGINDAVDGMKKAATSNEEKEDIDSVVSKAKEIVQNLYKDDVDFKYAPIGCYIIGKNNIFLQFLGQNRCLWHIFWTSVFDLHQFGSPLSYFLLNDLVVLSAHNDLISHSW